MTETAAKRKDRVSRAEKAKALYEAGAVQVIEEWLRESEVAYLPPRIGGGKYTVEGSRGVYELEVEIPVLGAPEATCTCEDHRRANAPHGRCKHALAVLEHVRAADREIDARPKAVRRSRPETAS